MPAASSRGGPVPRRLAVSFFPDVFDQRPLARELAWGTLVARLVRFPLQEGVFDKRRLPCWAPAELADGRPASVSALVLDVDDGAMPGDALDACWPYTVALHTTWRHHPAAPRFRLILPLARPVPAGRWTEAWRLAVHALDLPVDRSCSNASRRYLLPARPREDATVHADVRDTGQALDLLALMPAAAEAGAPVDAAGRRVVVPRYRLDRAVQRRLALDPAARARLARTLNASIRGEGHNERAEGLLCPACGRPSAWFLLAPERATRARCKHQRSCGWTGPVTELRGRAA